MNLKALVLFGVSAWTGSALSQTSEGYFDSNGVKIHYVTEGVGQPVVLVHGWMSDSTIWGKDAAGNTRLQGVEGFQLIAMDCRGHGKSDKPHEVSLYGAEMAADVTRLLDHLKIDKAHLVGYSMGSFIVGKVAAMHPDRILSVVYGGQAPILEGARTSGSNEVDVFAKAVDEGKGLGPYILYVMPPDRPKLTLGQANAVAALTFANKDVQAFAAAGRSLGGLRVKVEDLQRCKAPTLFVYGGNESAEVKDSVSAARKALGRGETRVIEGADHMTTLVKPAFGLAILDFLRASRVK